ncbi:unnamed protein product [Fraxinus pennsylvanica]|uniref:S-acyltransferase n=1 Tax=Fraxinus pennsylvanica TaxID=56036 RepID=A0AAD2E327_9LAMI|nr:unnamed protein product [Fraxinus pennsylvanica]
MELNRFPSIFVLSAFLFLGFIYYVTVFIFIEDWLGLQSSAGTLNALVVTFLASLCAFSFCVYQETKKTGVHRMQCDKCSTHRPPRAHHCRVCRRCVLKMDHHCIWINNCVGHRNYKSFLVLIFYATVASTYSATMIISCVLQNDWDSSRSLPLKIFYVGCGVMIVGLSLTFGTFLCWHIYLTAHNMTTIEYYEGKRAAWLARKSGLSYHHPFDVGVYKNITLVLGPNMLKWLWPTSSSHIKDGLNFPKDLLIDQGSSLISIEAFISSRGKPWGEHGAPRRLKDQPLWEVRHEQTSTR